MLQHAKTAFGEEIMSRFHTSEWLWKFKTEMTSTAGGENIGHSFCIVMELCNWNCSQREKCKSTFLNRCSTVSMGNCEYLC
jgi:hypothetical protein